MEVSSLQYHLHEDHCPLAHDHNSSLCSVFMNLSCASYELNTSTSVFLFILSYTFYVSIKQQANIFPYSLNLYSKQIMLSVCGEGMWPGGSIGGVWVSIIFLL